MSEPTDRSEEGLRGAFVAARNDLLQPAAIACGVLLVAHIMPKSPDGRPFRLILTIAYFAALLQLCWSLNQPLQRYLEARFALTYNGSPLILQRSWQQFVVAASRSGRVFSWVAMVFVALTALRVFQYWAPSLQALSFLTGGLWWLSLATIGLFPVYGRGFLVESFERWRALEDNRGLSAFKPQGLDESESPNDEPPVLVVDDSSFRAGGVDWHWDDFFTSCIVFGQPGSGKTVCVLNALLDGLLGSSSQGRLPASGLILDPKGDFRDKIARLMSRIGRSNDLLILDPGDPDNSARWNPLDCADDEMEIAERLAATMQALGRGTAGNESFWIDNAKRFLRHAIRLIRVTNEGEPPSFVDVEEMASSDAAIRRRILATDPTDRVALSAIRYFMREWFGLAPNTRSSISAQLTTLLDPFLVEPYSTFFAGESTVNPEDLLRDGKVLYVYMPVADREAMSRTVCTLIKLEFFREVLRNPSKTRNSLFLCDEFQQFMTTSQGRGDADFFERSRQSRHANIIATQNYPALLKAARAAGAAEEVVENLVGNCALKLFLRNTDAKTNDFASAIFGRSLVAKVSSSRSQDRFALGGQTLGRQDDYDQAVGPEEFARLATPNRREGIAYAEAIGLLGSRSAFERTTMRWRVHPL